jgi:SET domain-containing protein
MGLEVKKSLIPVAGLGLFAVRPFAKGETICEYMGDKITVAAYDKKYANDNMGSYGMQLDATYVLDAAKTSSGVARYACDYHGSGKKPNAEYVIQGSRIFILALKNIKAGDEILADYGEEMHKAMGV